MGWACRCGTGQRSSGRRRRLPRRSPRPGAPLPDQSDTCHVIHEVTVAGGQFAPGHLGALTQIVPFEMVDAALAETGAMQSRVRLLPARVVVYLLLAAALFAECGYRQVWARLVAALCPAPGLMEALNPLEDESHGGTEEVPR